MNGTMSLTRRTWHDRGHNFQADKPRHHCWHRLHSRILMGVRMSDAGVFWIVYVLAFMALTSWLFLFA